MEDVLKVGNRSFHVESCLNMGFKDFCKIVVNDLPEKRQKEIWRELGGNLPTKAKEKEE